MSGHSKWAQIKRKKGKVDAARGRLFTKLIREISIAVRMGGADPAANSRLRVAMQVAKDNNMPTDNIQKAIRKASGDEDGTRYEEHSYEGYGPKGFAHVGTTGDGVRHCRDRGNETARKDVFLDKID